MTRPQFPDRPFCFLVARGLDCPHFAPTQCASVCFNRHLEVQVHGYYLLISIGYSSNIAFGRQGPEVRILSPRPINPAHSSDISRFKTADFLIRDSTETELSYFMISNDMGLP